MGKFIIFSALAGVVLLSALLRELLSLAAVGVIATLSLALDLVFECKP